MAIPTGKHTDLPWPFSLIPRKANAVSSDHPPSTAGSFTGNADAPKSGYAFSFKFPFGFTFAAVVAGHLVRIGTMRYDYVDHYYTIPTFTIKKVKS